MFVDLLLLHVIENQDQAFFLTNLQGSSYLVVFDAVSISESIKRNANASLQSQPCQPSDEVAE
jgi:hypothetical protein